MGHQVRVRSRRGLHGRHPHRLVEASAPGATRARPAAPRAHRRGVAGVLAGRDSPEQSRPGRGQDCRSRGRPPCRRGGCAVGVAWEHWRSMDAWLAYTLAGVTLGAARTRHHHSSTGRSPSLTGGDRPWPASSSGPTAWRDVEGVQGLAGYGQQNLKPCLTVAEVRPGRDLSALWLDLAVAGMCLPPGVIPDGEAVVYVADRDRTRISFSAAQPRALSSPPTRPGARRSTSRDLRIELCEGRLWRRPSHSSAVHDVRRGDPQVPYAGTDSRSSDMPQITSSFPFSAAHPAAGRAGKNSPPGSANPVVPTWPPRPLRGSVGAASDARRGGLLLAGPARLRPTQPLRKSLAPRASIHVLLQIPAGEGHVRPPNHSD
jgi:hypothetical protein